MLEEERQKTKIAHNEGIVAGRAEGIEAGRAESRIAFAKTLLNNNEPMDKIILYTGLTIEEINKLK